MKGKAIIEQLPRTRQMHPQLVLYPPGTPICEIASPFCKLGYEVWVAPVAWPVPPCSVKAGSTPGISLPIHP